MVKYNNCGRAHVGVSNMGPEPTTNIVPGDVMVVAFKEARGGIVLNCEGGLVMK
jgi:hypothetical protein